MGPRDPSWVMSLREDSPQRETVAGTALIAESKHQTKATYRRKDFPASQFQGPICHGGCGDILAAGVWGTCHPEAESDGCVLRLRSPSCSVLDLLHSTMPFRLRLRVSHPLQVNLPGKTLMGTRHVSMVIQNSIKWTMKSNHRDQDQGCACIYKRPHEHQTGHVDLQLIVK